MTQTADRRLRGSWVLIAAAWAALCLAAAPAGADAGPGGSAFAQPEPARFFLEEIRIEGAERASEEVVLAESRLRIGTEYTEDELRDAVVRVHRLPFVLTTEFSLGKGSERGKYVLTIRIFETHRLFYAVDRRHTQVDEPVLLDGEVADEELSSLRATAGYRIRVGAYGEAVVAADTEQGLQAGYTHYDLFDRGATLSIAVSKDYDDSTAVLPLGIDPRFSSWQIDRGELASARFAFPLAGNHGLLLRGEWLHGDSGTESEVLGTSELADRINRREAIDFTEASIAWVWDNSDDPITPRSGRTFEAGLEQFRLDAGGISSTLAGGGEVLDSDLAGLDSRLTRVVGRATWHRPLGAASSVSWRASAALGTAQVQGLPLDTGVLEPESYGTAEAAVGATVRHVLWQPRRRFETLWLEGVVDVSRQALDLDHPSIDDSVTQSRAGIRLTLRDSWGVMRVGFYFVTVEGSGP